MRKGILFLICLLWSSVVYGQGAVGTTLSIGSSPTPPDSSTTVRITGLATSGGNGFILSDGDGDFIKRIIAKADLPAVTVFTDQTNTFGAFLQTFNGGIASTTGTFSSTLGVTGLSTLTGGFSAGANSSITGTLGVSGLSTLTGGFSSGANSSVTGTFSVSGLSTLTGGFNSNAASSVAANLTITSANDLIVGTGGIRAGSGPVTIRNVADSSDSATFGDSSIALLRNTAVTGTFSASGNATFTLDVAVNGGDITSSAATLNINSGGIINMQDRLTMASANAAGADNWASWTTGWNCSYAGSCDMRHLQADELHVRLFIAELQEAHNGAELWVKSTAILDQAFACPASGGTVSIRIRDFPSAANMRVFSQNDWVLFRPMSRTDADTDGATDLVVSECVGQVTSYVDGSGGTEGTQAWTFTRGTIGGTGGSMVATTNIPAENLALDFGVSGAGFLEATVNDGAEGVNGPYFQSVKWTGSPASAAAGKVVTSRFGKLTGITTTADEYGFIAGIYGSTSTGQYVKASNLGVDLHGVDFTLWDGANQAIILRRGSGSAPYFGLGNPAPTTYGSGSGVWMGDNSGTYAFRAGNPSARWFSIDDTNGLEFKSSSTSWTQFNGSGLRVGVAAAGNGNILADTSGNMFVRQGTVVRMKFSASNGPFEVYDDDGTTVRVNIGTTQAQFGSTSAARIDLNYAGSFAMFDAVNERQVYIDNNNIIMGNYVDSSAVTIANRNYVHIQDTSIALCNTTTGCGFSVTSGDVTNMSLAGNITLTTGGNIVSTSNFALNATDGLLFSDSSSDTNYPRMIRWAGGSFVRGQGGALNLKSGLGVGSGYGQMFLQGSPSVGGEVYFTSSNGTSFSNASFQAHTSGASTLLVGSIIPSTGATLVDGTAVIGNYLARYDNINLALDPNTDSGPAFVIVNKGGGGADANSALGYIVGVTYTAKVRNMYNTGDCDIVIKGGVVVSTTCTP